MIEAFTSSKSGNDELNEDSFYFNEEIVAIFDGATSQNDSGIPRPGRRASLKLAESASKIIDFHPEKTVHELNSVLPENQTEVAVGAIFHIPSKTIVRVGDVHVGINGKFHMGEKEIDKMYSKVRIAFLKQELQCGKSIESLTKHDPAREIIRPLIEAQRVWLNNAESDYGYAAYCGRAIPSRMIEVFSVPNSAEIVLATDGYYDPKPTLDESESVLADAIQKDPLCINIIKSVKGVMAENESFDDRTYIRVKI